MVHPRNVFYVRHGQDKTRIVPQELQNYHHSQFGLTDQGRSQIKAVGDWLKTWLEEQKLKKFDFHYTSTTARATESAVTADLPEALWDLRHELCEREQGFGGTSWPNFHPFHSRPLGGQSMAEKCRDMRDFHHTLVQECGRKNGVVFTHHDSIIASRINYEGWSPDDYVKIRKEKSPEHRVANGQIVQYSCVDPGDPARLEEYFRWERSFNPSSLPGFAGHDWKEIRRPRFTNEMLRGLVNGYPRF